MSAHILPDSRMKDPVGSEMVDWPLPGGKTVRCEAQRIYCANCGHFYGYVPKENTAFTFWLCDQCAEDWAPLAGTMAVPDEAFQRAVHEEMIAKHGHVLTEVEVATLRDQQRLAKELELLEKESPYPVYLPK